MPELLPDRIEREDGSIFDDALHEDFLTDKETSFEIDLAAARTAIEAGTPLIDVIELFFYPEHRAKALDRLGSGV